MMQGWLKHRAYLCDCLSSQNYPASSKEQIPSLRVTHLVETRLAQAFSTTAIKESTHVHARMRTRTHAFAPVSPGFRVVLSRGF